MSGNGSSLSLPRSIGRDVDRAPVPQLVERGFRLERKTAALREYAARHAMTVVFANYGGPSGGLESGGRSAIWSETGKTLAQLDGIGEGLVIASRGEDGWRASATAL